MKTSSYFSCVTCISCLIVQIGSTVNKHENSNETAARQPNLILFLADDFGYGDLSVYGHPTQEWGPIDNMALNGMRFTQFYATSVFCSPSRVAVLTGRHPRRVGAFGDKPVFMPGSSTGLPREEETLAESLKSIGYRTGMVGKWHLGVNKYHYNDQYYFPHNHGFDFVGTFLPFTLEDTCDEDKHYRFEPKRSKCFLFDNRTMKQQPMNLKTLTSDMVYDAKAFIHESEGPFFLYFPLLQTHIPFFNHPNFDSKSRRGRYGDQVNEMQWAVGEVLHLVRELGMERDTMTMFVSDHGAQRELCSQGGSNGLFHGGKGNYFEGGLRVPAIVHWPGVIPGGTVKTSVVSTLDILPTFREIAGASPSPQGVLLDGKSFHNILYDTETDISQRDTLLFFCNEHLVAARHLKYKIHFAVVSPPDKADFQDNLCSQGIPKSDHIMERNCDKYNFLQSPLVYNVEEDPGEDFPLSPSLHSEIIERVRRYRDQVENTFSKETQRLFDLEFMTNSLIPCCNPPYCICNFVAKH